MLKRTNLVVGLVLALGLVGCTSAPELAKYPRTQMERPYTLPAKVATWTTILPFGYYSNNTSSAVLPPIPIPLFWTVALTDKWSLNWAPLPTSVSYQIAQTDTHLLGLSFGAGYGYGSGTIGVVIAPAVAFFYRQELTPTVALEVRPAVAAGFYTGGNPTNWATELDIGPLFQLTPVFALRARGTLKVSNGTVTLVTPSVMPPTVTSFTVPLSLSTVWSVGRQWDLNFGYTFDGIGYSNGYQGHTGSVSAVHYW